MSDCPKPSKVDTLDAEQAAALNRDGYLLFRSAVPEVWRDHLRTTFDAGERINDQWAAPRGVGWRHSLVDLDPTVQRACRLSSLLAAAERMLVGPFFLCKVEGHEPPLDGGYQSLRWDGVGRIAIAALIFLPPVSGEGVRIRRKCRISALGPVCRVARPVWAVSNFLTFLKKERFGRMAAGLALA